MAVEPKRGCGYRKVGGTYLVGSGGGSSCDRLPLPLTTCPCCSQGIKQARGWTWVDVNLLVGGVHSACKDEFPCPLCMATPEMGKAGLLWIGEGFYKTPALFMAESHRLGISRRISSIPRGFKVGETWVLLAHAKTMVCDACSEGDALQQKQCQKCKGTGMLPGIFYVFRPAAIERIVTETESKDQEKMDALKRQGLTPVIVPDNDPDHRGSVYDKEEDEGEELEL